MDGKTIEADRVVALSQAFAFLGNSLLEPINRTPSVGIDPLFWSSFPDFDDAGVKEAVEACLRFADSYALNLAEAEWSVERIAIDYARLFIGPPRPAAPPWETAYAGGEDGVGFGQPTFQMRERLREAGLEVVGGSNQYADHMGIELLLLSVLLERAAKGEAELVEASEFAREHPASWVEPFRERICGVEREGYYGNLLRLSEKLVDLAVSIASFGSNKTAEEMATGKAGLP